MTEEQVRQIVRDELKQIKREALDATILGFIEKYGLAKALECHELTQPPHRTTPNIGTRRYI